MQRTHSSSDQKLATILEEYKTLANSNPYQLRKLFPPDDIWRLFVEKNIQINGRNLSKLFSSLNNGLNRFENVKNITIANYIKNMEGLDFPAQLEKSKIYKALKARNWTLSVRDLEHLTFEKLTILDKAWIPFEINEPGYFSSLYDAFPLIFDFTPSLNLNWILQLHITCMQKTEGTNYKSEAQMHKFRDFFINFGLSGDTTTLAGIRGLIQKAEKGKNTIGFAYDNIGIEFTEEFRTNLRKDIALYKFDRTKLKEFLWKYTLFKSEPSEDFVRRIQLNIDYLSAANEEFPEALLFLIKNPRLHLFFSGFKSNDPKVIWAEMQILMDMFQQEIAQTSTMEEKLRCIIKFVHECAWVHPLRDGNTRTLYTCMFNHLLLRNGFPLCLLDNFNIFEGHSVEELYTACLHGMQNTFELIKTGKLFGLETIKIKKEFGDAEFNRSVIYMEDLARKELIDRNKDTYQELHSLFGNLSVNENSNNLAFKPSVQTLSNPSPI